MADNEGTTSAARPTREYVVRDYDQIVYRGTDRERALAAWDAAGVPDCWVIECRTYPVELRRELPDCTPEEAVEAVRAVRRERSTVQESAQKRVGVTKELLLAVLDEAEGNLWQVHVEFCVGTDKDADGRHCCDKEQERIDALRQEAEHDEDEAS